MNEYSKNYNTIWALNNSKLNGEYQQFKTIRKEVKVWLVNEKEKKRNSMQVDELISLLESVFEFGNQVMHSIEFIEYCSFNLASEYVQRISAYLMSIQYNLELKSVSQISKHQQFIETEIEKVNTHMKNTYVIKPYHEVLMNFSEKDFRDTLDKNIVVLKNKIKELRYIAPKDETISGLLKNILYDVSGLESTQKHIFEYYQKNKHLHDADLEKHFSIERALIRNLKELKNINK